MVDDLAVLMALRVQGIASAERVADAVGAGVAELLTSLAEKGLAEERTGRVAGFTLTADGSERLDELLADEGLRDSADLKENYDLFMEHNDRLLKICSDWQVRRVRGVEEPNDHTDPAYDFAVIDRLSQLHDRAKRFLSTLPKVAPRFAQYDVRLSSCVDRLFAGDTKAFTAPLAESYHTVWFELHQDLLLTLGLKREV